MPGHAHGAPPAPGKTKHTSHPKVYTCPHTKIFYCNPCDACECSGCGMEWAGGKIPETVEPEKIEEEEEAEVSASNRPQWG